MADLYAVLVPELRDDPLGRGYSGMTAKQVLTSLYTVNRTKARRYIPPQEIFESVPMSGYINLSADNKVLYNAILAMGDVDIRGTNTRASLAGMFAAGTVARTNLLALQTEPCSRAEELEILGVTAVDIVGARTLL